MVEVKVTFYCGNTNEPPSHLRGQKRDFSVQQQKKGIGKALRNAGSNIAEGVQNPPQSIANRFLHYVGGNGCSASELEAIML
jgi:malate synthase